MCGMDVRFFPQVGVYAYLQTFYDNWMEGNSDFIFTFFNKFDGDAIHTMGFFGIKFVNDADNVRDTNIYLSEGVESEEGRLGRYDAVRGEGFTVACKQLIKAFSLSLKLEIVIVIVIIVAN